MEILSRAFNSNFICCTFARNFRIADKGIKTGFRKLDATSVNFLPISSSPSLSLPVVMAPRRSKAPAADSDEMPTAIGKKATAKGKAPNASASAKAPSKKTSKAASARTSVTPDSDNPLSPRELELYKSLEKRKRTTQKAMQEQADQGSSIQFNTLSMYCLLKKC